MFWEVRVSIVERREVKRDDVETEEDEDEEPDPGILSFWPT